MKMSKRIQIAAVLGLLFCLTQGQHLLSGFNGFNTFVDSSPDCNAVISGSLANDSSKIFLYQGYRLGPTQQPKAAPSGCNYHHWKPDSFFYGDKFDENMAWALYLNDSNSDYIIESWVWPSTIQMSNGTTCVSLPQKDKAGLDQYVCRPRYEAIPSYIVIGGTGNLTFNATGSDNSISFLQGAEMSKITSGIGITLNVNTSFPSIVGHLYDACNTTNITISSLSNEVMVSTDVDLSANIQGMWLSWALLRQNNSAPDQYTTVSFSGNTTLFNSAPSSAGCWDMGIHYSDLMSDITFCSQGCSVSFVLTDSNQRIYVLKTDGLWTAKNDSNPNGGSGSTGGNSTNNGTTNGTNGTGNGNGSTSGNGTNNGTNNNGGNNGAAANSALTMGVSTALLLISFTYLMI